MQIFHKDDFGVLARTDLHTCCCAVYIQCNQTTGRDRQNKQNCRRLVQTTLAITQTHADLGLWWILWLQATNDAMNVLNIAQTCRSTYTTKLYHFHFFLKQGHWIDSTNSTNIESSHNFAKHMLQLLSRTVCTRLQLLDKFPLSPLHFSARNVSLIVCHWQLHF